jgi:spore maturation protein CgeB
MALKILISGSDKIYAIENFYVRYLKEAGAVVELFPANSIFHDYYYRGIVHKLIFRLGLSSIYKKINTSLLQEVNRFKPDVVWIFKGMETYPSTLEAISKLGIVLVNYNPDNPFLFTGKGSGNKNISNSVGLYNLHFAYSTEIKNEIEKQYKIPTELLPFGFDVSDELIEQCANEKEILKACFIGNPDEQRCRFLQQLAEGGVELDLYGNNWERYLKHPNIKTFQPVYGDEMWKCFCRYRVQLNMMRIHNTTSHNMRSFEVPAVGGILLAPDTPDHALFFEKGNEIFTYTDAADCISKIKNILALSPLQAQEIRMRARQKSVDNGYSYKKRSDAVLKVLSTLVVKDI